MNKILVLITISDNGIDIIKSNTDLPKKEMEFVNKWKEESILVSFFISVTKKDVVLIFKNIDEHTVKKLIEMLPYFPYMIRIDYHYLNQQFGLTVKQACC